MAPVPIGPLAPLWPAIDIWGSMVLYVTEGIIAYILADLLTGIYHWATDRGWNIASQVRIFHQHHEPLATMVLDLRPALLGLPLLLLALYSDSTFLFVLGLSITFSQFAHYFAHGSDKRFIRLLQRCWLILPPEHHQRHHAAEFGKNYCTLSGWNNWWLNYFFKASPMA